MSAANLSVLADADAEKALLGSVMLDSVAFADVGDLVSPESFTYRTHADLWKLFGDLLSQGRPVDAVTVRDRVSRLADPIPSEAILDIVGAVPTSANARYYAEIVAEKATRRALWKLASDASRHAADASVPVEDLERMLSEGIVRAGTSRAEAGRDLTAILKVAFADLLSKTGKRRDDAIGTPWKSMNTVLNGGLLPGQLVYVAAPPSMGKTSFALQVASHVAVDLKKPVVVFSLETSGDILAGMMIAQRASVPVFHQKNRAMSEDDMGRLMRATVEMSGAPMTIHDESSLTASAVRSIARREALRAPLGLVMLDFVQLVSPGKDKENRNSEITYVSGQMKQMAKELKCPVVCCAQLNREAGKRPDKRPVLTDLRDSGSLEQDADIVIFIHRPSYYTDADQKPQAIPDGKDKEAEVIIAKQKLGARNVKLDFHFEKSLFRFDHVFNREEENAEASV